VSGLQLDRYGHHQEVIAVLTYLWDGWRPVYGPEHVHRMKDMLAEHFKTEHQFFCVTDRDIPGIDTIPLPKIEWLKHSRGVPCGYYKLWSLSREAAVLGTKIITIDLDTLIMGDITSLFTDEPFKALKGVSCPYNTSLFQVEAGKFPHVWEDLTEESARRANQQKMLNGNRFYGSDQAVVSDQLRKMPTWSERDGIYQYSSLRGRTPEDAKIVFFAGQIKPWESPFKELYWNGKENQKARA
jgi:hypothetical protein